MRTEWNMLWIRTWLSVRFDAGRLALSDLHETDSPVPRWTVAPEEPAWAVATAEAELEDFARRLELAVASFNTKDDVRRAAQGWRGW